MGKAASYLDPTAGDNIWSDADDFAASSSIGYDLATGNREGGILNTIGDWTDYNLMGGKEEEAINKAADEAEAKQQDIIQLYADQYQSFIEMTAPYRTAGESFIPEFQDLLTSGGKEGYMQRALNGQEFQNIAGAATDQLVSNSAALGNRLSSGIQRDILSNTGQLATNYANQSYQNRINELGQGINLGLGAMGTQLQGLQSTTAGQAGALGNIANINLQAANAAAMQPNMLGGLAGAGLAALIPGAGAAGIGLGYNIGSSV